MKKIAFILYLLSSVCYAQLSNMPTPAPNITAFKQNALNIPIIFEDGFSLPDTITAEIWEINGTDGLRVASIVPSIEVSGQTVTVKLTKSQVGRLKKNYAFYLLMDGEYKIGARITTVMGFGVPSSTPLQVSLPDIGLVKINLIGDPALAQAFSEIATSAATSSTTAAATATTKASQALSSAASASASAASIDPKVATRTPYGTSVKLRAIADTSFKSLIVNDKGREGIFNYNPSSSLADDSSMVIVSGGRRYERVHDYVRPEFFGAIVNDGIDDGPAIQKALNFATLKGMRLQFSSGEYITSITLKPKIVYGATQYNLTIAGEGKGVTVIKGTTALSGKNLIEVNPASGGARPDSYVEIKDITFFSVNANMIIYANNVIQFKLTNCEFRGGETACVQIGDGVIENYFIYVDRCYFNGQTSNSGMNKGLLRLYHARFAEVTRMVADGGKYALDIWQTDRVSITNCFLEGAKTAALYIHGSGGGGHKVIGNDFTPYGLFDPNGTFTGEISGVIIESVSGGSNNISIQSNYLNIPADLPKVILSNTIIGVPSPSSVSKIVTGGTSGATAYLSGYDAVEKRIVLDMISGTFAKGETLTQATSGATITTDSIVVNQSYGMRFLGNSGFNTVSGNIVKGNSVTAMDLKSDGNQLSNNYLEGYNGILVDNHSQITGNRIITTGGYAAKRPTGYEILTFSNNIYNGPLINISP